MPACSDTRRRGWRLRAYLASLAGLGVCLFLLVALGYLSSLLLPAVGPLQVVFLVAAGVVVIATWLLRPGADVWLLMPAVTLTSLGLLALTRLDADAAQSQLVRALFGLGVFLGAVLLLPRPEALARYRYLCAVGGLLLLALTVAFGTEVHGARLWIDLGGLRTQPSELAKLLLAIFFAAYLASRGGRWDERLEEVKRMGGRLRAYVSVLGPMVAVWAGALALFALQRDLGTTAILFGVFLLTWYGAVGKARVAVLGAAAFAAGVYGAASHFPHVQARFAAWVNPWAGIHTYGYQITRSLFSIGEGGLLGVGLGKGTVAGVPAASTDYIFTVFADELGLAGGAAVILLLALLAYGCIRAGVQSPDGFLRLLALSVGALLGLQAIVSLAGLLRAAPMTGLTLPFVSKGGSSLVTCYAALGITTAISSRRTPAALAAVDFAERQSTARVGELLLAGLLCMVLALGYWQVAQAAFLIGHPDNPRGQMLERSTPRGAILDRNGRVLVDSVSGPLGFHREYRLGARPWCHLIGYDSEQRGRVGLERTFNRELTGITRKAAFGWNGPEFTVHPEPVRMAIDAALQKAAIGLLESTATRRGAAVVVDPRDGRILAMASVPTFDPALVDDEPYWSSLLSDPQTPLLNRATLGLYPPGSAFKVVTLLAVLRAGKATLDEQITCNGSTRIGGRDVHCYLPKGHGTITVREALVVSCNVAFAQLGARLTPEEFLGAARSLGLDKAPSPPIPASAGHLPEASEMTPTLLAECGFGQGTLVVTPLSMCLVAAAVANGGDLLRPQLVESVGEQGVAMREVERHSMQPWEAEVLRSAMIDVVKRGTGTRARIAGIVVAGKTGTAQNPHGEDHAWFIGFAPADQPRAAVAVIVENAGFGGQAAAPLARALLVKALQGMPR